MTRIEGMDAMVLDVLREEPVPPMRIIKLVREKASCDLIDALYAIQRAESRGTIQRNKGLYEIAKVPRPVSKGDKFKSKTGAEIVEVVTLGDNGREFCVARDPSKMNEYRNSRWITVTDLFSQFSRHEEPT
jgi:hypothetical protein